MGRQADKGGLGMHNVRHIGHQSKAQVAICCLCHVLQRC